MTNKCHCGAGLYGADEIATGMCRAHWTVALNAPLTQADFDRLTAPKAMHGINSGRAFLTVSLNGERFEMDGPHGRHSLAVIATDLDRLNAHWTGFALRANA